MCGRFGLEFDDDFYPRFNIGNILYDFASRYNIAPGQLAPVIVRDDNRNSELGTRNSRKVSELRVTSYELPVPIIWH